MRICLVTNTYLPHRGGVARSVCTFAGDFRSRGHEVLVVAPTFPGPPPPPAEEAIVARVPALHRFHGSGFSVGLPFAAALSPRLLGFRADIVHSQHPFLLGDTALRLAWRRQVPVVFTHHTRYEDYAAYAPFPAALRRVAGEVATHYANLCDGVVAPGEGLARTLQRRGVSTPMTVIPTGIDAGGLAAVEPARARSRLGLPPGAFVVGHVGRLAPEKNLGYLGAAVGRFLAADPRAWFLVVGEGPSAGLLQASAGGRRVHAVGPRDGAALGEAYRAMDVFAFSSRTETQGLVLAEAMAAGVPVVALDAPAVREVVRPGGNGVLVPADAPAASFAAALAVLAGDPRARRRLSRGARATARTLDRGRSAERMLAFYAEVRRSSAPRRRRLRLHPWAALAGRLHLEWELLSARARAMAGAVAAED